MQTVCVRLRIFGLVVTCELEPGRAESILSQWRWALPDAPTQRSVARLPGTAPIERSALTVRREPDAAGSVAHVEDYRLASTLTREGITRCAGRYLMLHAGGVCDPQTGRVAGLVAASGMGKTTATRHFCTRGYGYVTDEALIVGDARGILPYPKPLSVVIDPAHKHEKSQHDPGELGLAAPRPGPLTLGPIVLLRREESTAGRPEPQLNEIYLLDGLAAILPQSSATPQIPDCLALLRDLVSVGGGLHELRYTEIDDTDELLQEVFTAEPRVPVGRHVRGNWHDLRAAASLYEAPTTSSSDEARLASSGAVVRAPFVDALVDDERLEALVLLGSTPTRLSGIGTLAWVQCESAREPDELLEACIDVLGEHPRAREIVRETVETLLMGGVLRPAN